MSSKHYLFILQELETKLTEKFDSLNLKTFEKLNEAELEDLNEEVYQLDRILEKLEDLIDYLKKNNELTSIHTAPKDELLKKW